MRVFRIVAGVTAAAALSWAAFANAQVNDADNESESRETDAPDVAETEVPTEIPEELFENRIMDEITVIAGPQGQTPYELEMERQALMKEAIYAEMRLRERDQEELAWRQSDPDLRQSESRFKWGYSPQAQQRMSRENDFMYDLSNTPTKPATLFRAEF
jgi:hypothetical protein